MNTTKREKEVTEMKEFIVEHKYCKATMVIVGYDIWDAYRKAQCDYKVWVEVK